MAATNFLRATTLSAICSATILWIRSRFRLRKLIGWTAHNLPYAAYGKNKLRMMGSPTQLDRYFNTNYTTYFLRKRMLNPEWMMPADSAFLERMLPDNFNAGNDSILSKLMYFEATNLLTGDFLTKVDRASMAASLEVRCPMLDHEFCEFATKIPAVWKWKDGKGKRILVDALGDRLPPELLNRGKMGFGVPLDQWFRGPLREFVHDSVLGKQFLDRGIVSPDFARYLVDEHESGRRNNYHQIYALLMLELWFESLKEPVAAPDSAPSCVA